MYVCICNCKNYVLYCIWVCMVFRRHEWTWSVREVQTQWISRPVRMVGGAGGLSMNTVCPVLVLVHTLPSPQPCTLTLWIGWCDLMACTEREWERDRLGIYTLHSYTVDRLQTHTHRSHCLLRRELIIGPFILSLEKKMCAWINVLYCYYYYRMCFRWGLVTLPLPYLALTTHTRIRVRQLEDSEVWPRWWALDNVYIGRCLQGCNGRGLCQPEGECR